MDQIFRDLVVDFAIDLHGKNPYEPSVRVGLCLTYRRKRTLRGVLESHLVRLCLDRTSRNEYWDFHHYLGLAVQTPSKGWSRPTDRELSDLLAFGPKTLEGIRLVQILLNGFDVDFLADEIRRGLERGLAPFWKPTSAT